MQVFFRNLLLVNFFFNKLESMLKILISSGIYLICEKYSLVNKNEMCLHSFSFTMLIWASNKKQNDVFLILVFNIYISIYVIFSIKAILITCNRYLVKFLMTRLTWSANIDQCFYQKSVKKVVATSTFTNT